MLSKKNAYIVLMAILFAWISTSIYWMKRFEIAGLCVWLVGLIALSVLASVTKSRARRGEQA